MGENMDENTTAAVLALRQELGLENEDECKQSDAILIKFVGWKADLARQAQCWQNLQQWKSENKELLTPPLRLTQDPDLKRLIQEGIMTQPPITDKDGRPILFGRLRLNNTSDGRTAEMVARMAMYNIEVMLNRPEAISNGIVVVHDFSGLKMSNIMPRVPALILDVILGHKLPIRVAGVYFVNAPFFFPAVKAIIGAGMTPKMRKRLHRVPSLDTLSTILGVDLTTLEILFERIDDIHSQSAWVEQRIEIENSNADADSLLLAV
uniref:CRAL-TRIO domain-containing protein n=1 Tax=Fibrocapsa japonica TaxID=94617 RepID=A0A6U1LXJ2_9STRA